MKLATALTIAGALALGGIATLTPTLTPSATARQASEGERIFDVDPVHSMIFFRISHLDVSYTYGRFNEPTGVFNLDFDNPDASVISVEVPTTNVDTANEARDRHLRSADFFNAKQFPVLRFEATSFEKLDSDTMQVTGDLSLHGVTKEITVDLNYVGEGDTGRQGYKAGFEGEFTIMRSEYGMDKYQGEGALGDEVTLMVTFEGKRR